jgi:hypothetical protein
MVGGDGMWEVVKWVLLTLPAAPLVRRLLLRVPEEVEEAVAAAAVDWW